MKLEEIHEAWERECRIDRTELGEASIMIPQLHARWLKVYSGEKMLLAKLKTEEKQLRVEKHQFLTIGDTKETLDKGWKNPIGGKPLRQDLSMFLEADQDVVNMSLRVAVQKEKVDAIEEIMRQINWRNAIIKNAIEDLKWKQGG